MISWILKLFKTKINVTCIYEHQIENIAKKRYKLRSDIFVNSI